MTLENKLSEKECAELMLEAVKWGIEGMEHTRLYMKRNGIWDSSLQRDYRKRHAWALRDYRRAMQRYKRMYGVEWSEK